MDLWTLVLLGLFGLFWFGLARISTSKADWQSKERAEAIKMIAIGLALMVLGAIAYAVLSL